MEAEAPTVLVGVTTTRLTVPHPYNPPRFFTGRMPFLPPNQQRQSTEGTNLSITHANTQDKAYSLDTMKETL